MSSTKEKLHKGGVAVGSWNMIPHPNIAEMMAAEAFDWICVDMEHTAHDWQSLENIARAVKGSGKDLLVRLPGCCEVSAKKALDCGADGIIVPAVNTAELAEQAVSIAMFPPEGIRGASLARCTGFGNNFADYFAEHNKDVLVVVMLEHIDAVRNVDAILKVPGIDATFIGPYDLSASMGLPGQLDHPDVRAAQQTLLDACKRHGIAPGLHVVPTDAAQVTERIGQGFRFVALGLDTTFIQDGCRAMLKGVVAPD